MSAPIDEPVPKLPRGRGLKFSGPELFRIALTLVTLIGVIVLTRPCATAVSGFVTSFDGSGSETQKQMPKPGNVDVPTTQEMEQLRPGMTDEEIKAAIERSKARAAGSAAPAPAPTPVPPSPPDPSPPVRSPSTSPAASPTSAPAPARAPSAEAAPAPAPTRAP